MAFATGAIRSFLIESGGKQARIFADPAKISEFVGGLDEEGSGPEVITNVNYSGHRVTRFPGDPGYNRSGGSRRKSSKYMKEGSPATPGRPFFCEVTTGSPPNKVTDVTRFTYTGDWITLRRYFENNAEKGFVIRRESGRSTPVTFTDSGPGA